MPNLRPALVTATAFALLAGGVFVRPACAAPGAASAQTPVTTQKPAGQTQSPAGTPKPAGQTPAPQKPTAGQQPATPQKPDAGVQQPSTGAGQARPAVRRPRRPTAQRVVVRDWSGTPLEGIHVTVSGAATAEAATSSDGSASVSLADGDYRLRFEHPRFVTLEREVAIKNGEPSEIDVALSAAAPPPPPTPAPAPVQRPAPQAAPAPPSGPPVTLSVPSFLDKNFIGREPLKESILGCTSGATTRLLQLHDALALHSHPDVDEVLYVVAGEGSIRIRDNTTRLAAGSLVVVPRGVQHSFERTGKNPLIVLSTLAGAPCAQGPALTNAAK